jgi:putative transport protein
VLASGSIGNPAIVAYANQLAPTGNEGIAYAMISPGVGTILTVIAVQVVLAISAGAT